MGWGTTFKTEIYLSRLSFDNKIQLEAEIENILLDIEKIKKIIIGYACSTPNDVVPKDYESETIEFLTSKMDELFTDLEEQYIKLNRLEIFKEFLEDNPDINPKTLVS